MKLVIAVWCIALAGCGAASKQSAAMPAPVAPQAVAVSPRSEIEHLDHEITAAMTKDELPLPAEAGCTGAACAQAMEAIPQPLALTDPQCKPAKSDACGTSCDLSGSICKNADRICDLAKDLAGDDWAAQKCKSARQSCADSNKKCCTCML
jgi:hypothetical protein